MIKVLLAAIGGILGALLTIAIGLIIENLKEKKIKYSYLLTSIIIISPIGAVIALLIASNDKEPKPNTSPQTKEIQLIERDTSPIQKIVDTPRTVDTITPTVVQIKIETIVKTININRTKPTKIAVSPGDSLFIEAEGIIKINSIFSKALGPIMDLEIVSTPIGTEAQIPVYNKKLNENYKLGALLLQFNEMDEWMYCGSEYLGEITTKGTLIFGINVTGDAKIKGAYTVKIKVLKYHH